MDKVLFWDFNGTLAYNDWMFSKALYKILVNNDPKTKISIDNFKSIPMVGFPWQDYKMEYLHLTERSAWWENVEGIFIDCYKSIGLENGKAVKYANEVREELIKVDEFILYDDAIDTLSYFKERGYQNIILSNHIPELPEIVEQLGLSLYLSGCISSANVGYEKPNPKIFYYALEKYNYPKETWMIGDSVVADIIGAKTVGMKSVLVRNNNIDSVEYYSNDLKGLKEIII